MYSLKQSKIFILGCPHITDHRPLVKIFGDKQMDKIDSLRVFDLKEKTLMYDFEVVYREGPCNHAADVFSGYPATNIMQPTVVSQHS